MDKTYRRKLLKMALATPLALSVALVLDINPGLAFLGPSFVFNSIWLFPDPILTFHGILEGGLMLADDIC